MLFLLLCQLVSEILICGLLQICISYGLGQLHSQKFDRILVLFTSIGMLLIFLWIETPDQEVELLIDLIRIFILLIQLILEIVDSFKQ